MKVLTEIQELERKLAAKGPRGGEIIGKTESGKPIYERHDHPKHNSFDASDHMDAYDAHMDAANSAKSKAEKKKHESQARKHEYESHKIRANDPDEENIDVDLGGIHGGYVDED